uniref:Bm16899 n=1 Tax=Brugia malayi TaxID=6279 RepID=A0A1I9GDB1_BRUMA|nr:Bm16899 [Brugia malayi]
MEVDIPQPCHSSHHRELPCRNRGHDSCSTSVNAIHGFSRTSNTTPASVIVINSSWVTKSTNAHFIQIP